MLKLSISKVCVIENCDKEVRNREHGWCNKHYLRWLAHGDPLIVLRIRDRPECEIAGCTSRRNSKRFCHKHLYRWKTYGDPLRVKEIHGDDVKRFWSYVQKSDDCWLWCGTILDNGYGQLDIAGAHILAHRYAFFLAHGCWPEPLCLHSCDVRNCVNPAHLRAGTHAENMKDMVERGRAFQGSYNGICRNSISKA